MLILIVEDLLIVRWKKSILWELLYALPCHHGWFVLAPPYDLQLVPPCGYSSFNLIRYELYMLFLGDVSHVEELLYIINSI